MDPELYASLNRSWKSTCRIVLGGEIGELKDYEEWLGGYCPKMGRRESCISGKGIVLVSDYYSPSASFISSDEIAENPVKMAPLGINEIKDIDSIVQAVSEKWMYAGNRVLGNSNFVESSDLVMDSQYVAESSNITESSNVFSSFAVRTDSKNSFGSGYFGKGEFLIRFFGGFNVKRSFESHVVASSSDIYLSTYCIGCTEIMFSFFQRSKSHVIGNLQLPRDRYMGIKKKLLAEIAQELKSTKRFPSLFQLLSGRPPASAAKLRILPSKSKTDQDVIEKAFRATFGVICKQAPAQIGSYVKWLSRHSVKPVPLQSPFGNQTYYIDSMVLPAFMLYPKSRLVSIEEGLELAKAHLEPGDLVSLEKITAALDSIAYFTIEVKDGVTENIIDSPLVYQSSHIYRTYDATNSEYTGATSQALNSKYIFGGDRALHSEFCINCYNSLHLSRCFEVDTSSKCSDSLFCHNSEALSDCMFCFNVKGKRHAIGNTELAPTEYAKLKSSILEQLADEILEKKSCHLDIFTIGARK